MDIQDSNRLRGVSISNTLLPDNGECEIEEPECGMFTTNVYIPTSKVIDNIFGMGTWYSLDNPLPKDEDVHQKAFDVSGKKAKKKAFVYTMMKLSTPITPYDWVVFIAFCSLANEGLAHGEHEFKCTSKQIYQKMIGRKSNCAYGSRAIREVEESMQKMFVTEISFSWGEHAAQNKIDISSCKIPEYVEYDHLIPAKIIQERLRNGHVVVMYRVLEVPALFTYAHIVTQMETLDENIINMNINNTPNTITMKYNLIKRIARIKNQKTTSNDVIRMDWIFKVCQIDTSEWTRTEFKRGKDIVFRILNCLREKDYIKGYQKLTQGRSVNSVKIIY